MHLLDFYLPLTLPVTVNVNDDEPSNIEKINWRRNKKIKYTRHLIEELKSFLGVADSRENTNKHSEDILTGHNTVHLQHLRL